MKKNQKIKKEAPASVQKQKNKFTILNRSETITVQDRIEELMDEGIYIECLTDNSTQTEFPSDEDIGKSITDSYIHTMRDGIEFRDTEWGKESKYFDRCYIIENPPSAGSFFRYHISRED